MRNMEQTEITDQKPEGANADDWRAAGEACARSMAFGAGRASRRVRTLKTSYVQRLLTHAMSSNTRLLVIENLRLIRTAAKEVRAFQCSLYGLPLAGADTKCVRVSVVARGYLLAVHDHFSEESCAAFLEGFQRVTVLECNEVWALQPALQRELLERLAEDPGLAPVLLSSLRQIADLSWKELFEAVNGIDRVLRQDPAGAYARMDFESRNRYRTVIAGLARRSDRTEEEIAKAALSLAERVDIGADGARAAVRRAHVGFYLIDKGLAALKCIIAYRPAFRDRIVDGLESQPAAFYLIGIEVVTCLVVAMMLAGVNRLTPFFAGLLLLLLPATQAAVNFVNGIVTFFLPPRTLPRLDFSREIPPECTTMVAVPALLLNEAQVRDLVLDLEIRYLANRDPNLYCALLTDCPDAQNKFDERDRLVDLCRHLVEKLNRRHPGSPFFLLHRHRTYNENEGRWMGWERKRGKLLDFNRLLRGGFDSFPVKVGDVSVLPRIRYVITLDADTSLPRDAAAKLIGAIAHPLNAAVVDPARGLVV